MSAELMEILIRVGMACLTGILLGAEREIHGRAAGLRTTVLVCLAATLAAILSDQFYATSFKGEYQSANWHPDPARLGAGILTGIGFLGAGVIMKQGNLVRGVTTASQIWLVTILGLCYGSGKLMLGALGTVASFLTLFGLHYIEAAMKRDWYATLCVTVSLPGVRVDEVIRVLKEKQMTVQNIELTHDAVEKTRTMTFALRFKRGLVAKLPEQTLDQIISLPGVLRMEWK